MQMIHDALSDEQLAMMNRFFDREERPDPEARAAMLDRKLRTAADLRAEGDDRNRAARRRAAALERDR